MDHYKALQPSDRPGWFVGLGVHRDSTRIARSNFDVFLQELGGVSDTVEVITERHWGVGWVEWIAIHHSDKAACAAADQLLCALADYPVLDELHLHALEQDEVPDIWNRMSLADRVDTLKHVGVSIFAARRDTIPYDPSGNLWSILSCE